MGDEAIVYVDRSSVRPGRPTVDPSASDWLRQAADDVDGSAGI